MVCDLISDQLFSTEMMVVGSPLLQRSAPNLDHLLSEVFNHLPPELQGDRQLVLEAVTKNWKALALLKDDR